MTITAPSPVRPPIWEPIAQMPRRAVESVRRYWKALVETIKEIWGKWTFALFATCNYVAPTLTARGAALWMYARHICERAGRKADKERYESQIAGLEQERAQLQSRFDALTMERSGQTEVARQSQSTIAQLQQDLQAAQQALAEKSRENGALSSRVDHHNQSASDALTREALAIRQRNEAIQNQVKAEHALAALKRTFGQNKEALAALQTQNAAATAQIASLRAQLEERPHQDAAARKKVQALQGDLNANLQKLIEVCQDDSPSDVLDSAIQPFLSSAQKQRDEILGWITQVQQKLDPNHSAQLDLAAIRQALSSEKDLVEGIIGALRYASVSTAASNTIEIYPLSQTTQQGWV